MVFVGRPYKFHLSFVHSKIACETKRRVTLGSVLSRLIGNVLAMFVNMPYCFSRLLLSVPGSVDVAVDSLDMGVEVEKWYPVTMESNKTNGGESSSIRLRFKYQVKLHRLPSNLSSYFFGSSAV